jgi:hypothetical protein
MRRGQIGMDEQAHHLRALNGARALIAETAFMGRSHRSLCHARET